MYKLGRTISGDGDSPAPAFFRPVIPEGPVLDAAVVPENEVVFLPAETDLQVDVLNVPEEQFQSSPAFIFVKIYYTGGEGPVHKEGFPSCFRMGPNHGMNICGKLPTFIAYSLVAVASPIDLFRFMKGLNPLEEILQRF